eukprot:6356941-Prymnesium_polylepis.2
MAYEGRFKVELHLVAFVTVELDRLLILTRELTHSRQLANGLACLAPKVMEEAVIPPDQLLVDLLVDGIDREPEDNGDQGAPQHARARVVE